MAVDEYSLWLETLVRIAGSAGVQIVGSTTRSQQGIELLESKGADIFILGLDRGGLDYPRVDSLLGAASNVRPLSTIVVSNDDDPRFIGRCLSQGAVAYVLKTIRSDDLSSTLRQAVDRCVYLFGMPIVPQAAKPEDGETRSLTRRELEVLTLVADGLSNVEVAKRLWISVATVKFHLSKMYGKLGVSNRTGAVRWAHQHGVLGHPPSTHEVSGVLHAAAQKAARARRPAQSVSRS